MKTQSSEDAIIIRRGDVERIEAYARDNCDLRDFLFIRLPKKIGLRTGEIATLRIENIDFDDRSFEVLDSKNYTLYPLPLDMMTLQLIKDLTKPRDEGFVFTHKKAWKHKKANKPLTVQAIWNQTHKIGQQAGVEGFHPRVLRSFFAANWAIVEHKSLELLRRILRHKSLEYTQYYISRLVFFEDVQKEYDEIRAGPIIEQPNLSEYSVNANYQKWCSKCDHEPICKFIEEFCSCECASSCKYYALKEMQILEG